MWYLGPKYTPKKNQIRILDVDCEHSQLHLFPNQELYLNVAPLFWVLKLSSEIRWQLMISSFVHFVSVKNLKMQTGI